MGNKKEDIKLEGLLIRKIPCKENDAMLTIITSDGLLSFYGRGVNKISSKNIASCSLLSYSSFVLSNQIGNKLSLKESNLIKSYLKEDDFGVVGVSNFILELLSKGLDEDRVEESKNIYPYVLSSLNALLNGYHTLSVALFFFIKYLDALGIGLNLTNCVRCNKKEAIVGLSYIDGGFICKNCLNETDHKLNVETLKFLHYSSLAKSNQLEKIPPLKNGIYPVLEGFSRFLYDETGIDIKSLKLLKVIQYPYIRLTKLLKSIKLSRDLSIFNKENN